MSVREIRPTIEVKEKQPDQLRFIYFGPENQTPTFIRDKGSVDVCHTTAGDRDVFVLEDIDHDLSDGMQEEQIFVRETLESDRAINIAVRKKGVGDAVSHSVEMDDYILVPDDGQEGTASWRPVRADEGEVVNAKDLPFTPEAGYVCGVLNNETAAYLNAQGIETLSGMPYAVVCDKVGKPQNLRFVDQAGSWQTVGIDRETMHLVQGIAPSTKAIVTPNNELVQELANRVATHFHDQEQETTPEVKDVVETREITLSEDTKIAVRYRNGLPEGWLHLKEGAALQQITLRPEHYRWLYTRAGQPISSFPEESVGLTAVTDENEGFLVMSDDIGEVKTDPKANLGIEDSEPTSESEIALNTQKAEARSKMHGSVLKRVTDGKGFQIDAENNVWIVAADAEIADKSTIEGVAGHRHVTYRERAPLAPAGSTLLVKIDGDDKVTYISGSFRHLKPKPLQQMSFSGDKTIGQVIKSTGKDSAKVRQALHWFVTEGADPFEVDPADSVGVAIETKKQDLDTTLGTLPVVLSEYIRDKAFPRLIEQKMQVITDVLTQKIGDREATIPEIISACKQSYSEKEIAQFMQMETSEIIKYSIEKELYKTNTVMELARELAISAGQECMTNDETITHVRSTHRQATILSIESAHQAGGDGVKAWREVLKSRLPGELSPAQIKKLEKIIDRPEFRGVDDVRFVEFANLLSYYEILNEQERRGLESFEKDSWTIEQIEKLEHAERRIADEYRRMVPVNQENVDRFTRKPEVVRLGSERIRDDIPTNEGPFHVFTEYEIHYPASVVEALSRMYREYNEAFRTLVEKNREWDTDYMYALTPEGMPINSGVQMDIPGMTHEFLEEAAHLSADEVYGKIKNIFEIENSLAMYGLLMRITSKNGEPTPFANGWQDTLDQIRERTGKKIALLAVTDAKYEHMKGAEFGKAKDDELTDVEVKVTSGFDRFFSPEEYKKYVEEHGEDSEYVLYCRTSDPLATLEDPTNKVDHPLLSDDNIRRIIKKHSLTFNIDNPQWERGDERRINDTKRYLLTMGLGHLVSSADQLRSPEFKQFLLSRGADPVEVESGQVVVRGKPDTAYGCYGHARGAIGDDKYISAQQELIDKWGVYIEQPEMTIPTVQDTDTGERYTVINRVFFTTVDGKNYRMLEGFASHMPINTIEAEKGRNHGSEYTKWVRIDKKPEVQPAVVQ